MNGLEKSGYIKTSADVNKAFKLKNGPVHWNCLADFLVNLYIGSADLAKSITYFR